MIKPSFSANPSHRSLPFLLQDWLHGLPDCLLINLSISFSYSLVCPFSTFRAKLTHVGFWTHVKIASRIVSYRKYFATKWTNSHNDFALGAICLQLTPTLIRLLLCTSTAKHRCATIAFFCIGKKEKMCSILARNVDERRLCHTRAREGSRRRRGWKEWVYEGWKGRQREKGDYTLPQWTGYKNV